ncbi:MAG: glutamate--tRNA ligase [Nocardioidaceae bacterium]
MLDRAAVDALFPPDLPDPEQWERRYPPRALPEGARVTRFCPSPTGFAHIGGVYVASIDRDIARWSGGVYFIRIEDTDQARVVEGVVQQFTEVFSYFEITADETDADGSYGPYTQSERSRIYQSYVRELLRQGKAYLCFATKAELAEITARQRAAKVPTGYYGTWAVWRDASAEDVQRRLEAGDPYVVRFRAPGDGEERVRFTDAIRGEVELEANRNDAVVLKNSHESPWLPTYHFAHAVDDHLMRVNLVIRGEEWVSSVPLHLQLFDALRLERIEYAHLAPLLKQEGRSKRKLSKRKDPEASASYYIEAGYPLRAVQYYLRGLANGRLAELPLPQALAEPIRMTELGVAGPLVDLVKLEDISADYIATVPSVDILSQVTAWADTHDRELGAALRQEQGLALRALTIERGGVTNPRKDLRKWSDFRRVYGYFFPQLFEAVDDPQDPRFGGLDPSLVRALASEFADGYQPPKPGADWFAQVRGLAARRGFAPSTGAYKADPDAYLGSIREASRVIRVLLTGATRSPGLAAVADVLRAEEVTRRVRAVIG